MSLPKSITSLVEMPRIPLDKIRENAVSLRLDYDQDSLEELGDSIRDKGQIQPVIVQPGDGDWFDLVIGSRRFRAAKLNGHQDIAGYIIDPRSPPELLLMALAENLQRVDLNPFEEAQGFLRLMKEYGLTQKAVADGVNKSDQYIKRRLQLLSMPEEVVSLVSDQRLGLQYIETLARLPSGDDQVRLARSVIRNGLTLEELRVLVVRELNEPARPTRTTRELTPIKITARVGEFMSFLQKTHRRLNLRRVNAAEKQAVLKALKELEDEVRLLRAAITGVEVSTPPSTADVGSGNIGAPRNHGQEWTTRDIARINSPRRPSDEELAVELGRTPGAIRAMRAQTAEKA
ncbi:ParB/RepB/Spo0J family partition protein [Candidatus Parcubacteria bacterium]|nr:MAG: ParB/RepB/Spo0J family partition protein [Candidatus Parcubacteria bacterium]